MKNIEISLLSLEEANNLKVLQKYGHRMIGTDFALLTGGEGYSLNGTMELKDPDEMGPDMNSEVISSYYTKSINKDLSINFINHIGYQSTIGANARYLAIRPTIKITPKLEKVLAHKRMNKEGVYEVDFGAYPQEVVGYYDAIRLEKALTSGNIIKTGKTYTIDKETYSNSSLGFTPLDLEEYQIGDKKYIRMKMSSFYDGRFFSLSNGQCYRNDKFIWVEVSPVTWLIDEESQMLIAKKGLLSGIAYKPTSTKFEDSFMSTYLNRYMAKNLFQGTFADRRSSVIEEKTIDERLTLLEEKLRKLDPNNQYFKEEIALLGDYVKGIREDYQEEVKAPQKHL